MAKPAKKPAAVVPAERLAEEIDSLLRLAREHGEAARSVRTDSRRQRVMATTAPGKADIASALYQELRDVLEEEITPAVDTNDSEFFEREEQREIQKKALIGLRTQRLRKIAHEMRLDKRGKSEDVAERIARSLKFDEHAIAQLILENEEEPEPEHRFADRLFPTAAALELEPIARRIEPVLGRYIRIGVARWLCFQEIQQIEGGLIVDAIFHSYQAHAASSGNDATLSATPSSSPISLKLLEEHHAVHIEQAGLNQCRGALKALEAVTDVRRLGYLPFSHPTLNGPIATFDPITVLMLDLIYNRLPRAGAVNPDLTAAKFRIQAGEQTSSDEDPERPTLKSVKFEGRHLLDSAPACRLIAQEGRALVDISMIVGIRVGSEEDEVRFPIRFVIEADHIAVMTGYGRIPEIARTLHAKLITAAESALDDGVSNVERLAELAERILSFSASEGTSDRATMLANWE